MPTLCCLLLAVLQSPYPIHTLQVEGNSTLPAEGILRAAGLAAGQNATPDDLQAAAARLSDTGLFASVTFRYKPAPGVQPPGFDVVFQVAEFPETYPVRLEFPGQPEPALWQSLRERDPLLRPEIPATERAADYYARAIQQYLNVSVARKLQVEPSTGRLVTFFRPASVARVSQVRFEGVRAVPVEALEKAAAALVGAEFTEAEFRALLEGSVLPLFERRGHLRAAFQIAEQAGQVTVAVEEGPVYRLGRVEVACQGVPADELLKAAALVPGSVADWSQVSAAAARMQSALARYGFLEPSSQIERTLDDAAGRVDVIIALQKGPQSTFGELEIKGLPAAAAARARKLWRLAPGAPLNVAYIDEFLRAIAADPQVRGVRTAGRRLRPRLNSGVVDVVVSFE